MADGSGDLVTHSCCGVRSHLPSTASPRLPGRIVGIPNSSCVGQSCPSERLRPEICFAAFRQHFLQNNEISSHSWVQPQVTQSSPSLKFPTPCLPMILMAACRPLATPWRHDVIPTFEPCVLAHNECSQPKQTRSSSCDCLLHKHCRFAQ